MLQTGELSIVRKWVYSKAGELEFDHAIMILQSLPYSLFDAYSPFFLSSLFDESPSFLCSSYDVSPSSLSSFYDVSLLSFLYSWSVLSPSFPYYLFDAAASSLPVLLP
jgi:DNA phosphorothioation-dependent restriction protein DptG